MAQPFRPTLKEKKRYLVYEPANDKEVVEAFKELFGITGAAQAGIMPIVQKNTKSILRVNHTSVDELRAALVWSNKKSVLLAGTLKKAKATL